MLDIFGNDTTPPKKIENQQKAKFKYAFQKWSDKFAEIDTTPLGKCGYGLICDYCLDNAKGRPCVKALVSFAKERKREIDYTNISDEYFEDCFCGDI